MSQENVLLLRALIERWNRGERDDMSMFHPDVEWLPRRVETEGAYRGIAGIERFIADTDQTFEKYELRPQFVDLGERVLALGSIRVRARHSGIDAEIPLGGLFEFRDGKLVRWEALGSEEAARRAAGLE